MTTWCTAPPWMTFWLVVIALHAIAQMWRDWCNKNKTACDCAEDE